MHKHSLIAFVLLALAASSNDAKAQTITCNAAVNPNAQPAPPAGQSTADITGSYTVAPRTTFQRIELYYYVANQKGGWDLIAGPVNNPGGLPNNTYAGSITVNNGKSYMVITKLYVRESETPVANAVAFFST